VKGDLEFHNVWFKYPSRMDGDYVLKRFSLRIPHGKVVAVVGASGIRLVYQLNPIVYS